MTDRKLKREVLRISLGYMLFAGLWILLSDKALAAFVSDPKKISTLSMYKGWAFVAVTGLLLYGAIQSRVRRWQQEMEARHQVEQSLHESEERYRIAIEGSQDAVSIVRNNELVFVNQRFVAMFGYGSSKEALGDSLIATVHPDDQPEVIRLIEKNTGNGSSSYSFEYRGVTQSGTMRWIEASVTDIAYSGRPAELVYLRDVTDRKEAENQVKSSLAEKEVLLREIHHRVKNNLAVIAGMLSLQADSASDEKAKEILTECQNRVKAMAEVHTQLYQSQNLASIDFGKYLDSLVHGVFYNTRYAGEDIALNVAAEPINLDIDHAIPLGLVANELVTNSLKHAFRDSNSGTVTVNLTGSGERVALTVSDNGRGLPAGFDPRTTETLGMRLVTALVEQLNGTIELHDDGGTTFTVSFTR
jgi:PAS domain S-box-containing protein